MRGALMRSHPGHACTFVASHCQAVAHPSSQFFSVLAFQDEFG